MSEHRWSGWPGAWCLDCGIEDATELCIATHSILLICVEGHDMCEDPNHAQQRCTEHVNPPCSEPGSRRHDPYARPEEVKCQP